jgi:hypothetical protein
MTWMIRRLGRDWRAGGPLAWALMLTAALAFVGCDDDPPVDDDAGTEVDAGPPATLTGIAVTPETIELEVGETQTLTVTGSFDDGSTSSVLAMATFATSDDTVATVAGGSVAAVAVGTATITVTVETFEDTVAVTVVPPVPTDPTIPMAVDNFFQGRAGFGSNEGAPLHTEDEMCDPARGVDGAVGACHRFVWDGSGGAGAFTGAFWVSGSGFGDNIAVDVEDGANEVTFYAWGESGGEVVGFGVGLASNGGGGAADGEGNEISRNITLTDTPTQYTIRLGPLVGYDTVASAFSIAMNIDNNPSGATFYVDDIQWIEGDPIPTDPTLPMAVDFFFPGRAGFGTGGPPSHTEDTSCPTRPDGAVGDCHRIQFPGGGFSGAFWIDGTGFDDNTPVDVEGGATELTFTAWAASSGVAVEFGAGGDFGDVGQVREVITLNDTPTEYTIPLTNLAGYTDVTAPFIFSISGDAAAEFYIDDIQWVAGGDLPLDVIFDDDFGPGIFFQPFGGSDNNLMVSTEQAMVGTSSLRVAVPGGGYTGGAMVLPEGGTRDFSAYNAVTFWIRTDTGEHTLNVAGVGDNAAGVDLFKSEITAIAINTTWQQITLPLPNGSKFTDAQGLFHFAEGSDEGAYVIYFDDIRYETLSGPITNPRPTIAELTQEVSEGGTYLISGNAVTYAVDGTDLLVSPAGRAFFDYTSSDPGVATVDSLGTVTGVGSGTAAITATLDGVAAAGTLTINVSGPLGPTAAAPTPPARAAGDVISVFSDAYTQVPIDTFRASFSDVTNLNMTDIGGDNVLNYEGVVFFGIEAFGTPIDASAMTTVHLDYWVEGTSLAVGQIFAVKLVDFSTGGVIEGEVIYTGPGGRTPELTPGTWVSLDIPLSDFAPGDTGNLTSRSEISQIIISSNGASASRTNLWIDNLYFYR